MKIIEILRKLWWRYSIARSKRKVAETHPKSDVIDVQEHHKHWMALGNKGRFHEAIELCLATIDNPNEIFVASSFLGYAYFQITNYELAIAYLENAVKKNPSDYYSTFFLARSLKVVGRKKEALGLYTACCGSHLNHAEEILNYAMPLAFEIKETDESKKFFGEFQSWAERNLLSSTLVEKLLFFQGRDIELHLFFQGRDIELQERINDHLSTDSTRTSFRHILSVADWVSKRGGVIHALGNPEAIRIVTPFENEDVTIHETTVYSDNAYVAEIPDASIISGSSLIFVENDTVLSDLLADKQYGHFAGFQYDKTVIAQRRDALLVKVIQFSEWIPEGIMLSGLASDQYGHWFSEFLPKLRHFERHPRFPEIPIIIDTEMPASHYDFLRALVANPLHILPRGSSLKVGTLLVAPTITFFPIELFSNHSVPPEHLGAWSNSALRYIGDKIRDHFGVVNATSDRIFLSRKNCIWRRLINEDEIIDALKPLGFRVVFIEECNFEEQVRIFQKAEFIVAPNGSALNNLIFSNENIKILIFGQKNPHNGGGVVWPYDGSRL